MENKRGRLNGNSDEWSKEETLLLLNNVTQNLFNWKMVKVEGKTEEECRSRFKNLIQDIHNILNLMDTMSSTDTGEITFEEDRKKSQLPNRDRQKTSKPETPLQLFIKQKKELGESNIKNRLRTQYVALEDSEKMKWIKIAVNNNEEAKNILSIEEQRILRGEPKQPLKALGFFIQQKCHTKKMKLPLRAFQQLTSEEKDKFIKMEEQAKRQYEIDFAKFKKRNQEDQHVDELENVDEIQDADKADDGDEQSIDTMKRKRPELSSKLQTSMEKPGKKARLVEVGEPVENSEPVEVSEPLEVDEPTRIPSALYNYYKHFIYRGSGRNARKTYLNLDPVQKKKIREEHIQAHSSYREKFQTYIKTLSKNEMKDVQARILDEEQNESSDSDSDSDN